MIGRRSVFVLLVLTALVSVRAILAKQLPEEESDRGVVANQEWPVVGGGLGDERYSPLSQINTRNVNNLGAAWVSQKFEDGALSRVTPVVHDGLMFVTAGAWVYALDCKTGARVWAYQTVAQHIAARGGQQGPGAGVANGQGVTVGDGKVFVGLMNGHIVAIDEKTGKFVWDQLVGNDQPRRQGVSAAPVYANGRLFTSITFDEGRFVGRALSLDPKDGHELWRFSTIPGPGEPGHETWAQDNVW